MKILLIIASTFLALLAGAAFVIPLFGEGLSINEFAQKTLLPIDRAMAKGDDAGFKEFRAIVGSGFRANVKGEFLDLDGYLKKVEADVKDADLSMRVDHDLISAVADGKTGVLRFKADVVTTIIDHKGQFGKEGAAIPVTETFVDVYQLRKSGETWKVVGIERTSGKVLAAEKAEGGSK